MSRIITAALIALLIGAASPAQADKLAKALDLEESQGRISEARGVYQQVWDDEAQPDEIRARAGLGLARCCLAMGDFTGARQIIANTIPLAEGHPKLQARAESLRERAEKAGPEGGVVNPAWVKQSEEVATLEKTHRERQQLYTPQHPDLAASAEKLRKARAKLQSIRKFVPAPTVQEDPIEKRVKTLLRSNRVEEIMALGDAAVPTLKKIVNGEIKITNRSYVGPTGVDPFAANSINVLIRMARPSARQAVLEIMQERKSKNRAQIITNIANRSRTETDLWSAVILAAIEDPDREVRSRAAARMQFLSVVPEAAWDRVLGDADGAVRRAAFDAIAKSNTAPDAKVLQAFDRALSDSFLENRYRAMRTVELVKSLDWDRYVAFRERLLKDSDPSIRQEAYASLQHLPRDRRRAAFLAGLSDDDPRVRARCAEEMGKVIVNEDVAKMRPLVRDVNPDVRSAALSSLTVLPADVVCDGPDAEKPLLECARERTKHISAPALSILARAGSKHLVSIFLPQLRSDDRNIQACSLYFLMRHDLVEYVPQIVDVLSRINGTLYLPYRDRHFQGHPNVAPGIGQNGLIHWLRIRRQAESLITVLRLADMLNSGHMQQLTWAINEVVSRERRPRVLAAARSVKSGNHVSYVLRNLNEYFGSDPSALAWYAELLESTDASVRRAAADVIASHGNAGMVPSLIVALSREKSPDTAKAISFAVAKHATGEHISELKKALGSNEAHVQRSIIATLGRIGTRPAIDLLIARLDSEGSRAQVIELLGERRVKRAVPNLVSVLESQALSDADRKTAIMALGRIGDPSAVAPLLAVLAAHEDKIDDRRFIIYGSNGKRATWELHAAVVAIFDMGSETFLPVAQRILLGDDADGVKASVVQMLTFVSDHRANTMLGRALRHESTTIRSRAVKAVGQALLIQHIDRLRELVRDPDAGVRGAAARALRRFVELGVSK